MFYTPNLQSYLNWFSTLENNSLVFNFQQKEQCIVPFFNVILIFYQMVTKYFVLDNLEAF